MKTILITLLIAFAVAGGANYGHSIALQIGVKNSLNFACGNQDNNGNWNINQTDQYSYSCTGQPSWLSWSGSSLSGWVPTGWKGNFQIEVSYHGRTSGSNKYTISCDDNSDNSNWGDIWWWVGSLPATWTIACPAITISPVLPTVKLPSIPIVTPLLNGITGIITGILGLGNGNDNSYNCSNVNWSGSGVIASTGSDYCTLDSGKTIKFTICTSRQYRPGKKTFYVADKVNFECWDDGTNIWAKRVDCTS